MLSHKATPLLEELLSRLSRCETVPRGAERFHRIRQEVTGTIANVRASWWPLWIADHKLERLDDRVRLLEQLSPELRELIRESEELGKKVAKLGEEVDGISEPEISRWLGERQQLWKVTLAGLARDVERPADLPEVRDRLTALGEELGRTAEGLHWLVEADRLLRSIRSNPRADPLATAPLDVALPDLRRRLLSDGISLPWISELRQRIELVQKDGLPPEPETTATAATVSALLHEARRWSEVLDEDHRASRELLERHGDLDVNGWAVPDPEKLEVLRAEAETLVEGFRSRAAERRGDRLRQLESDIQALAQVCGRDHELAESLTELDQQAGERPHDHRTWMAAATKLQNRFEGSATTQRTTLLERLEERVAALAVQLTELQKRRLPETISSRAAEIASDLDELRSLQEATEALRNLRVCEELAGELKELATATDREEAELAESGQRLEERSRALREASSLAGIGLRQPDLEIANDYEGLSFEQAHRHLADDEARQQEREEEFLELCAERASESFEAAQQTLQHLAATRPGTEELPLTEALRAPATDLGEAALRTVASCLLRRIGATRARRALEELGKRREKVLADLAALPESMLGPGQRETLRSHEQSLSGAVWVQDENAVTHLAERQRAVEDAERFLSSLRHDERQTYKLSQELRRRLAELREEGLSELLPELAGRVEALVHGVREHPARWGDALSQLHTAKKLLEGVETHARHLAAHDLEAAARVLRNLESSRSLASRRALLAELDACDPGTLPPWNLRRRVLEAAGQERY